MAAAAVECAAAGEVVGQQWRQLPFLQQQGLISQVLGAGDDLALRIKGV